MKLLYFLIISLFLASSFAIYTNFIDLDPKLYINYTKRIVQKDNISFILKNFSFYKFTNDHISLALLGKSGYKDKDMLSIKNGYSITYNNFSYKFIKSDFMYKVKNNVYCVNNVLIYDGVKNLYTNFLNFDTKTSILKNSSKVKLISKSNYVVNGHNINYNLKTNILKLQNINAIIYTGK